MQNNTASITTIKNGTKWIVRKGYERLVDEINPDDVSLSLNGRPHELVKENNVRSVISVPHLDIADDGVFIKVFKKRGFIDSIKHLFVPTGTRTEWDVANRLLNKDINTALPLAMCEKRTLNIHDKSVIITKNIPDSVPLMEYCQANFIGTLSKKKNIEKRNLLDVLAEFIRNIHDKGFYHKDLHMGNILIKFNKNHSRQEKVYSLYLMDLHHVKILNKLACRERMHNLAQIFNSLDDVLSRTDKCNFVKTYGSKSLNGHNDEYGLVDQIDVQFRKIRNTHYKSRLKRCLKESSGFSIIKLKGYRIFSRKGFNTNSFLELIKCHQDALANNDVNAIIKRDTKTALTRFPFQDTEINNVVVKQYKTSCVACLVKNIFRGQSGRKPWIAGNGLLVYGLDTAKPLALAEKKVFGIVTDSYIIMEGITNGLEMDRYILKNFQRQSKKKIAFIKSLAKTIGDMHNQKVYHCDMKTCNIMVRKGGRNSYEFLFLDFDRVVFGKNIDNSQAVKTLTQINLSTPKCITIADRLRFLIEYLKQRNLLDARKNILKEIVNISKSENILYVSFKGDVTEDW